MRTIYLATCLLSLGNMSASSAVMAYVNDFSSNISGWTSIGGTPTTLSRLVSSNDGPLSGDMLTGEGALVLDTVNGVTGDEAVGFTLGGTMTTGNMITLDFGYFNGNSSFYTANVELFNLTDTVSLGNVNIVRNGNEAAADGQLIYTALASDEGDMLQIRITETANNSVRNIWIDNISLTSVPEPSSTAFLGLGALLLTLRRRK